MAILKKKEECYGAVTEPERGCRDSIMFGSNLLTGAMVSAYSITDCGLFGLKALNNHFKRNMEDWGSNPEFKAAAAKDEKLNILIKQRQQNELAFLTSKIENGECTPSCSQVQVSSTITVKFPGMKLLKIAQDAAKELEANGAKGAAVAPVEATKIGVTSTFERTAKDAERAAGDEIAREIKDNLNVDTDDARNHVNLDENFSEEVQLRDAEKNTIGIVEKGGTDIFASATILSGPIQKSIACSLENLRKYKSRFGKSGNLYPPSLTPLCQAPAIKKTTGGFLTRQTKTLRGFFNGENTAEINEEQMKVCKEKCGLENGINETFTSLQAAVFEFGKLIPIGIEEEKGQTCEKHQDGKFHCSGCSNQGMHCASDKECTSTIGCFRPGQDTFKYGRCAANRNQLKGGMSCLHDQECASEICVVYGGSSLVARKSTEGVCKGVIANMEFRLKKQFEEMKSMSPGESTTAEYKEMRNTLGKQNALNFGFECYQHHECRSSYCAGIGPRSNSPKNHNGVGTFGNRIDLTLGGVAMQATNKLLKTKLSGVCVPYDMVSTAFERNNKIKNVDAQRYLETLTQTTATETTATETTAPKHCCVQALQSARDQCRIITDTDICYVGEKKLFEGTMEYQQCCETEVQKHDMETFSCNVKGCAAAGLSLEVVTDSKRDEINYVETAMQAQLMLQERGLRVVDAVKHDEGSTKHSIKDFAQCCVKIVDANILHKIGNGLKLREEDDILKLYRNHQPKSTSLVDGFKQTIHVRKHLRTACNVGEFNVPFQTETETTLGTCCGDVMDTADLILKPTNTDKVRGKDVNMAGKEREPTQKREEVQCIKPEAGAIEIITDLEAFGIAIKREKRRKNRELSDSLNAANAATETEITDKRKFFFSRV